MGFGFQIVTGDANEPIGEQLIEAVTEVRVEEELSDLLTAAVEVRVKKRVKRHGRFEDQGELAIAFGSLEELNGLIDRLRGGHGSTI